MGWKSVQGNSKVDVTELMFVPSVGGNIGRADFGGENFLWFTNLKLSERSFLRF